MAQGAFVVGHCDCECPSVYLAPNPVLHLRVAHAAYSIEVGRRFTRGPVGIGGRYPGWSRRRVR